MNTLQRHEEEHHLGVLTQTCPSAGRRRRTKIASSAARRTVQSTPPTGYCGVEPTESGGPRGHYSRDLQHPSQQCGAGVGPVRSRVSGAAPGSKMLAEDSLVAMLDDEDHPPAHKQRCTQALPQGQESVFSRSRTLGVQGASRVQVSYHQALVGGLSCEPSSPTTVEPLVLGQAGARSARAQQNVPGTSRNLPENSGTLRNIREQSGTFENVW